MENVMAKNLVERYKKYSNTPQSKQRALEVSLYWTMSTLESYFWSTLEPYFDAKLYLSEDKQILVCNSSSDQPQEFPPHKPKYNISKEDLPMMLQDFEEIFNNIKYIISDQVDLPSFKARYMGTEKEGQYEGYHTVHITVDMKPRSSLYSIW